MPKVRVKYLAPICDIAGTYYEDLVLPEGASTMGVIELLIGRYGQPLRELFYRPAGEFRPQFIILRNTQPLEMEELDEALEEGDTITFVPPIAGG